MEHKVVKRLPTTEVKAHLGRIVNSSASFILTGFPFSKTSQDTQSYPMLEVRIQRHSIPLIGIDSIWRVNFGEGPSR